MFYLEWNACFFFFSVAVFLLTGSRTVIQSSTFSEQLLKRCSKIIHSEAVFALFTNFISSFRPFAYSNASYQRRRPGCENEIHPTFEGVVSAGYLFQRRPGTCVQSLSPRGPISCGSIPTKS